MKTATYALPKDSKAWADALKNIPQLNSGKIATYNIQALQHLPIFALVIVVDNAVIQTLGITVDSLMQQWIDTQPKWTIATVSDDEQAKSNAHTIVAAGELADVSVFRYILLPTDMANLTPEKRDAAAHIMDEQLTSYLKKHLKLQPTYQFELDEHGQVADFDFDRLGKVARTNHIDVHILSISQVLRKHKLVCFDMDSTLIEQEVIVELAKMCGVEDKVSQITERAMRGEIDFAQSFAQRVALLEDIPESVIDEIIHKQLTLSSGAHATIRALKAMGCTTVLVSGGFEPFAKHISQTLGMDEYYANPLLVSGGKLTGHIDPNIVDGKQKAKIVAKIADRLAIDMEEVVCVGDGANDLPMMAISNIGVAYKAKPIVQAKADAAITMTGLEGVLYALGHRFDKIS